MNNNTNNYLSPQYYLEKVLSKEEKKRLKQLNKQNKSNTIDYVIDSFLISCGAYDLTSVAKKKNKL